MKKALHSARAFKIVGVRGFEPPISRPPDVRFNRAKLHPDVRGTKIKLFEITVQKIRVPEYGR